MASGADQRVEHAFNTLNEHMRGFQKVARDHDKRVGPMIKGAIAERGHQRALERLQAAEEEVKGTRDAVFKAAPGSPVVTTMSEGANAKAEDHAKKRLRVAASIHADANTLLDIISQQKHAADNMLEVRSFPAAQKGHAEQQVRDTDATAERVRRLAELEADAVDGLEEPRKFILYGYILCFVVYLVWGGFFQQGLYRSPIAVVLLLAYVALPFVVDRVASGLASFYKTATTEIARLAPRDTYIMPLSDDDDKKSDPDMPATLPLD